MRLLAIIQQRLRSLFRKGRQESDINEELRFHLGKEAEQNLARGVAPEEAHHEALL